MKTSRYTYALLPQYSPEYAPVELAFSQMKTDIKWKEIKTLIDLNKEEGAKLIAKALARIEKNILLDTGVALFFKWKETWTVLFED